MGACVLLVLELSDGDCHYDWLIDPSGAPPPIRKLQTSVSTSALWRSRAR